MKASASVLNLVLLSLLLAATLSPVPVYLTKRGMSRGAALVTLLVDWADHYSTAAAYLRANDLLPPSAMPKK